MMMCDSVRRPSYGCALCAHMRHGRVPYRQAHQAHPQGSPHAHQVQDQHHTTSGLVTQAHRTRPNSSDVRMPHARLRFNVHHSFWCNGGTSRGSCFLGTGSHATQQFVDPGQPAENLGELHAPQHQHTAQLTIQPVGSWYALAGQAPDEGCTSMAQQVLRTLKKDPHSTTLLYASSQGWARTSSSDMRCSGSFCRSAPTRARASADTVESAGKENGSEVIRRCVSSSSGASNCAARWHKAVRSGENYLPGSTRIAHDLTGGLPTRHSYISTPSDQMSTRWSYESVSISGAR